MSRRLRLESDGTCPPIYDELDNPYRYKILYGGRGAARSWTVARKLLRRGHKQKIRILCTRELQKSIKESVHKLLTDQIKLMNLESVYDWNKTGIWSKNGTEFMFLGVRHNPSEIKSLEGIDICWIEEGENLTEESWDIIDPTIRKEGSEIWANYNTRFKFDHLHKIFVIDTPPPGSLVIKASYDDNPWFPEVLRTQMENMKVADYEKYLHIWRGHLKILAQGAVYGSQIIQARKDGRIGVFPVTNGVVETFWDLGKNNQTSIWFMQKVGNQYRFIDYYESRLKEIPHYCKVLKGNAELTGPGDSEACPITEAANSRRARYNYGTHHMPHDIKQDMLGMAKTRQAQFEEGGVRPIQPVKQIKNVEAGIEMARDIFPECYFHEEFCDRGIEALSNYRYKYKSDDDTYAPQPHHDWASNGSDAFRQFPQGYNDNANSAQDYRGSANKDYRGANASWMR
jgi:phage terminase large subunit